QAACDVAGIIGGRRNCAGLTAHGRGQSARAAAQLAAECAPGSTADVYSGPLRRLQETAAILAPALGVRARKMAGLDEQEFGSDADGAPWNTMLARSDIRPAGSGTDR